LACILPVEPCLQPSFWLLKTKHASDVWLMTVILTMEGRDQEDCSSRPAQVKSETLSQKYPTQKRTGKMAQEVECLPSKRPWVQTLVLPPKKSILKVRKWGWVTVFQHLWTCPHASFSLLVIP
jgi:hypothetical protein